MISYSEFKHLNTKSPFTLDMQKSKDYRVYHSDKEIPVYTCRISKYPFNTWWPGHQRFADQTDTVSFVNIVSDEDVTLTVEPVGMSCDCRIMLKPYSKGVIPEVKNGKISFKLIENGGYVLELGDYHNLLYVFNNRPVPCENPKAVTYYFGEGVHFPGKITLKSGDSVYLHKNAYVYGNIFAENAKNIKIYGNGIFDDSGEERFSEHCYEDFTIGNIKLYDCENVEINGVGFTNSAIWCVNLFHCKNVDINGIKVFGQWRYNTDGIDIVNSKEISIKNSFIHSFDDTVTVKGIDRYCFENNENIFVENCTLWCDWGKTCEIGLETNCDRYNNIVFHNCDVIRGGNTVCDIQNGDCAEVENITFENIRVELESFYTKSVLQLSDDMKYTADGDIEIPFIFSIQNRRFREQYSFLMNDAVSPYSKKQGEDGFASVKGVAVRNIKVYCDEKILKAKPLRDILKISVENSFDGAEYSGITVEGISLVGAEVTEKDLSVKSEGKIEELSIVP